MASNEPNWEEAVKGLHATVGRFQATEDVEYEVVGKLEGSENIGGDILVFDSRLIEIFVSFNPPTRGHMNIIVSALRTPTTGGDASGGKASLPVPQPHFQSTRYSRILLLLAVQNADKAPQPASFADRLAMMLQFAEDIHNAARDNRLSILPLEVAMIKHARFLDKATVLRKAYPEAGEIVFLIGFDTLVRLFDPKYYGGALTPLASFFENGNSIQCCFRPMEGGSREWRREQKMYLEGIREGKREGEGCPRQWGERVQMVGDGLEVPVSSTLVRQAIMNEDGEVLRSMLSDKVKKWIWERGLYRDL